MRSRCSRLRMRSRALAPRAPADGRGYPDGLTGEEIPIAAQVVSVADARRADKRVRCHKSAYDHETALRMIVNGECGTFNPLLSSAPLDASLQIRERLLEANEGYTHSTAGARSSFRPKCSSRRRRRSGLIQALETERIKTEFLPLGVLRHSVRLMIRQRAPSL